MNARTCVAGLARLTLVVLSVAACGGGSPEGEQLETREVALSTFGKTTVGALTTAIAANYKLTSSYALAEAGDVSALRIYLAGTGVGGSQALKGVIYGDGNGAPGSLLATTQAASLSGTMAPGWVELPFSSPAHLSPGTYWLGVHAGATSQAVKYYWDAATGGEKYNVDTYADGPSNPFGTPSNADKKDSIYATYTPSTVAGSTYPQQVLADAPVGYWRLDESSGSLAADASGQGHSGTYQNGVTLGVAGALGDSSNTAARFDGVDDDVAVGDAPELRLNGSFSVEFWAKLGPTNGKSWPGILHKGASNAGHTGYLVYYAATALRPQFKRANIDTCGTSAAGALSSSAYKHFVFTYDAATASPRWYVNGVLDTTCPTASYGTDTDASALVLGQGDNPGSETLDEVALYGSALSASRVQQHFQAAAGTSGAMAPAAAFSGTPTSGAAPLTVHFTDQSTGPPTSWSWSFGDQATSTQQNPTHVYASAGSYSVSLTVSNAVGSNTKTKANYVVVVAPPPPAGYPPAHYSVHHYWVGIDGSDAFNYASNAPRVDDFIAHYWGSWSAQGAPFKQYQPNGRVLFYANFGTAGDACCTATAIDVATARANGWLAHHNGAEINNPWGGSNKVVDLGKPGVAAGYVSALESKWGPNAWNGVFADDVNAWFNLWSNGSSIDGYASPMDYWNNAVMPLMQTVVTSLHNDKNGLVIPNVGDWANHPELNGAGETADGGHQEYYLMWNGGGVQSPSQIENEYASMQDMFAHGHVFYGIVHRTDSAGLKLAFCAGAIMAGDHPELARISNQTAYGSQAMVWDSVFETQLGAPTSSVQHASGSAIWTRSFASGATLTIDTSAQTCTGI